MESLYIRDELTKLLRKKKPDVADKTITTYVNNILRIQRELGQPTVAELEAWLDKFKPTQARNLMTPIIILYPGERHRQLFDKYNAKANSQLDQQRLSPSEMKHWVKKSTIRKMIIRLKEDCNTHKVFKALTIESKWRLRQMLVIWSIHYVFPWRNVLNNCKIARNVSDVDDKNNYYVPREQAFYISVFKTRRVFKRHGFDLPLKHKVPPKLAILLKKHIANRRESWGGGGLPTLFCDFNGRPLSKSAYSNLLTGATKKYLAKRVGSSLWRHIVLTEWSRLANPTLADRRAMARRMHQVSLITQMRYVRPEADLD